MNDREKDSMTGAIEDARAAAAELDRAVDACDIWQAWTHMAAGRDALRALIAEHERLTRVAEGRRKLGLLAIFAADVMGAEDESIQAARDDYLAPYMARAEAAEARIAAALAVTASSSVPLGVPEARHYDRLLAEVRRVLKGES